MKFFVTFKGLTFTLCASILTLAFSLLLNDINFFVVGEFLTGLVGLLAFIGIFVYLEIQFHFLNILFASTLIATGLGTFSTYINSQKVLGTDWLVYLGSIGISNYSVTSAQIVVNSYCLFIILFAHLSTSKHSNSKKARGIIRLSYMEKMLAQVRELPSKLNDCLKLLILSCLISLLQVCMLCTGLYTFHGLANDQGSINPVAELVSSASPLAVFSLGLLSSKLTVLRSYTNKYVLFFAYSISIIIQLIWFMGTGRRDLVYAVVLFVFGLRFSFIGKKFVLNRKSLGPLLVFILLLPVLYFGWKFFIFIRVLSYREPLLLKSNLFDIMSYAWSQYLVSDSQFIDQVQQHESRNLATRTFVLNYLAQLIENKNNQPPLFGQDLLSNFFNSLPRFIYNDKSKLLINVPLYHYNYGLPNLDSPKSLYFSAYGDFSWLGTLIYPLILFLVFYLALRFILIAKSPYFTILAVSSLTQLCLSGGENSITSWLVTFRDLIILLIIFKTYSFFLSPQKMNHS